MLKRTLCVLLIAICLLGAAFAEGTGRFTFMDEISWDFTIDEVKAFLGEGVEQVSDFDPDIGGYEIIRAFDREVCGYNAEWVMFQFYNGKLYVATAAYGQDSLPDDQALIRALMLAYGKPVFRKESAGDFDDYLSEKLNGIQTLCKWEVDEETVVKLRFAEGDPLPYDFYAVHLPTMEALDQAIAENT